MEGFYFQIASVLQIRKLNIVSPENITVTLIPNIKEYKRNILLLSNNGILTPYMNMKNYHFKQVLT